MSAYTKNRWAFYINLPIGGLALPVYFLMLPSPEPRPGATMMTRLAVIDWIGALLWGGAIVSFTMAINFGGVLYDWSSGSEIALFVVCGVLFIVFGLQQAFCVFTTREDRLFPVNLLIDHKAMRTLLIMFCTTAAGGAGIFVPVYFIPLLFQFTRGDSAIDAAVRLLPFIFCMVFACIFQGGLLSLPSGKFGLYMPWFTVGGCCVIAGGVLMYLVDSNTSQAWIYGSSSLLGIGVGMHAQSGFAIAQASVPESAASVAAAFIAVGQTAGINIALAISNAIFINTAENKLEQILPFVSKDQIQLAIAGVGTELVKQLPAQLQAEVVDVIVDATRRPYILVITAGALVLVLSLVMKRERLFLAPTAMGG
jgi:hypothetical protein